MSLRDTTRYQRSLAEQVPLELALARAAKLLYSAMCNLDAADPEMARAQKAFCEAADAAADPEVETQEAVLDGCGCADEA